jgi:hypothetical protein
MARTGSFNVSAFIVTSHYPQVAAAFFMKTDSG